MSRCLDVDVGNSWQVQDEPFLFPRTCDRETEDETTTTQTGTGGSEYSISCRSIEQR